MKKRYIILIVIFILIFSIFYYKKSFTGNNIIKLSKQDVVERILSNNFEYKAKVNAKIYSNKNENNYEMIQEETKGRSYLEVTSKSDISGLVIEDLSNKLIVKNTKLNLEKIYENYTPVISNSLFLNSFAEEYNNSNSKEQIEEKENIILKFELNKSTKYIKYKELYIDKKTGLPQKLIVKTSDKQIIACIEYINIEIL